ncbi:unnamed protein product, partial [Nesidiocoris tenuis]
MLTNTGHSVLFRVENSTRQHVNFTGGPLSYKYQLHHMHIHYGLVDQTGSEHTINGQTFPAEVSKVGQGWSRWAKVCQGGPKWVKVGQGVSRWAKVGQGGPRCVKVGQGVSRWVKVGQGGSRWPKIQIFGFNSQLYSNFSEAIHRAQGIVAISVLLQ